MTWTKTTECRVCLGRNIEPIIDLGHHPLADRFLTDSMLRKPEVTYPLVVHMCTECGYAGLGGIVDEHERYVEIDYSYTASNSPVAVKHFDGLAAAIVKRCGAPEFAVDIGGNDGTLLSSISGASGHTPRVLNIEPSPVMAKASRARGVDARQVFWSGVCPAEDGKVDLFTATNVLNHASDPRAFVREVATGLREGGWFVFEVPSLEELVRQGAFDTVYLEHVSYFGIRPLFRLLSEHGLNVEHVEMTPYMGGSHRVFARKAPVTHDAAAVDRQHARDIYVPGNYRVFMMIVSGLRTKLVEQVHNIRNAGAEVFAIGAAAKGNTLLNYCKFDPTTISCVLDASPHKIGKFTPGTHIPIVDENGLPAQVREQRTGVFGTKNAAIILPWNIAGHLIDKYGRLDLNMIVPVQPDAKRYRRDADPAAGEV